MDENTQARSENPAAKAQAAPLDDFELMISHIAEAQAKCARLNRRYAGDGKAALVSRHLTGLYHLLMAANFMTVSLSDSIYDMRQRHGEKWPNE